VCDCPDLLTLCDQPGDILPSPCTFRRSTSGFVGFLAGGPIFFRSARQARTVTSSTAAEFLAAAEVTKPVLHSRILLEELGFGISGSTVIREDNRPVVAMVVNPVYQGRTRHLDVQYHFVRECVADGVVRFKWVSGNVNVADILTKPLAAPVFIKHCDKLLYTSWVMSTSLT
jgi:hypothetical protein